MQKRALVLLLSVTLAVAALAVPVSAGGPGDCGLGGGRHADLEISECLVDVDAAMGTALNTVVTLRDLGAGDRFQVGLGNGADSGVYAEVTAAGNGYLVSLLQDGAVVGSLVANSSKGLRLSVAIVPNSDGTRVVNLRVGGVPLFGYDDPAAVPYSGSGALAVKAGFVVNNSGASGAGSGGQGWQF